MYVTFRKGSCVSNKIPLTFKRKFLHYKKCSHYTKKSFIFYLEMVYHIFKKNEKYISENDNNVFKNFKPR